MERHFLKALKTFWCVDAGLGYEVRPRPTSLGLIILAGMTVTGLADGVCDPGVCDTNLGDFSIAAPA